MKKLIGLLILILAMVFTLCACDTGSSQPVQTPSVNDVVSNTDQPQVVIPEKQSTALTVSNVTDYLIFSVSTSDIEKEDISYGGLEKADGKATVKITPKQSGEFENLSLTFTLETSSTGWVSIEDKTVEIPFDGRTENEYDIYSFMEDYVSSTPSYKVTVTSVSGNFVK